MFELLSSFSFTSIRQTFNERAKQALSLFYKQIINRTLVLQCIFCKVHIIGKSAVYMHVVTYYITVNQNTLILKEKRETSLL